MCRIPRNWELFEVDHLEWERAVSTGGTEFAIRIGQHALDPPFELPPNASSIYHYLHFSIIRLMGVAMQLQQELETSGKQSAIVGKIIANQEVIAQTRRGAFSAACDDLRITAAQVHRKVTRRLEVFEVEKHAATEGYSERKLLEAVDKMFGKVAELSCAHRHLWRQQRADKEPGTIREDLWTDYSQALRAAVVAVENYFHSPARVQFRVKAIYVPPAILGPIPLIPLQPQQPQPRLPSSSSGPLNPNSTLPLTQYGMQPNIMPQQAVMIPTNQTSIPANYKKTMTTNPVSAVSEVLAKADQQEEEEKGQVEERGYMVQATASNGRETVDGERMNVDGS